MGEESRDTPDRNGDLGAIEEAVLNGPARHTREQLAARSGVSDEFGRRLWRAMGLVERGEDAKFTDSDLEALTAVGRLLDSGVVEKDDVIRIARTVGSGMARLADAQVTTIAARAERDGGQGPGDAGAARALTEATRDLRADIELLQHHVWRRHLLAATLRMIASTGDSSGTRRTTVVFADLVGFTALSRRLDAGELQALVDEFERTAFDIASEHGSRVVKTIGDEVMLVADDVEQGADTVLALAETVNEHPDLPDLHAGLAAGDVLVHQGDVFGQVVNLAARLRALARPGTVLVDKEAAAALEGNDRYLLKKLRPHSVRGYGHLSAHVLRRATQEG